MSDNVNEQKRKAFELLIQKKEKKIKERFEIDCFEEERLRNWNNKKIENEINKKKKFKDEQKLENIISNRNNHYLTSCKTEQPTLHNELLSHRFLSKDLKIFKLKI